MDHNPKEPITAYGLIHRSRFSNKERIEKEKKEKNLVIMTILFRRETLSYLHYKTVYEIRDALQVYSKNIKNPLLFRIFEHPTSCISVVSDLRDEENIFNKKTKFPRKWS